MAYEGGKGRKPGGFGGKKPYGKKEGGYAKREGGYGAKKAFGDKKPYGKKPYGPRTEGEGGFGEKRSFGDKPYGKKPYAKREGGFGEKRAYGDKKPYGKKPYAPREGGYERKPREEGFGGERKSYAKREAGDYARPRREGGFGEKRPYQKREGGYERKPREGGFGEKREFGDKPYAKKPYAKREGGFDRKPREGGFERKPRFEREENRGDAAGARFDGKRQVKRERDVTAYASDGWLVGYHAVVAALKAGRRKVRNIWLLAEASGELAELIGANPEWAVEMKAKPDFEQMFGDAVHQGVAVLVGNLPQPSLPELLATKPKLLVALDQVTDPHNLGAIVRSCAAFGAKGVIVTEYRAAGLSATAAKAAAGAMEIVPVVEIVNLVQGLEMLKEAGFTVIGLAGEAEADIKDFKAKGPVCLVVGSEGDGLRRLTREHCDQLVKIKMSGDIESLNVSVATGIALSTL